MPEGCHFKSIWLTNPYVFNENCRDIFADVNLCLECYGEFEEEYMKNLKETYEQA